MTYWVLPESGIPISTGTVQQLTQLEQKTDAWLKRIDDFNAKIKKKWEVESADLSHKTRNVDKNRLLSLEDANKSGCMVVLCGTELDKTG